MVSSPLRKSETLPLRAKKAGPSDVFDDVAALLDNKASVDTQVAADGRLMGTCSLMRSS